MCLPPAAKRKSGSTQSSKRCIPTPNLLKWSTTSLFYDDDIVRPAAHTEADTQVTIDEVIAGAEVPAHTAEESAIFTKADDGMEEISGHYEPEEGADD